MAHPLAKATLLLSDHAGRREVVLTHFPFTLGRDPNQNLVLPYPSVSRSHARILWEDSHFLLVDSGSRGGTYINGARVQRHQLANDDVLQLGTSQAIQIRFRTQETSSEITLTTLLTRIPDANGGDLSLRRLTRFVEAARRLNDLGAIGEILSSLIEITLSLTGAERGYVFLRGESGDLVLAAGRNAQNEALLDQSTLSHSAIQHALQSGSEYIVTDTLSASAGVPSNSIAAHRLRAVLCIPLRRPAADRHGSDDELLGVLYLDSRQERSRLTSVESDLLNIISSEAALLVQHTNLARVEEEGRRYREELKIAYDIQQGLMRLRIPQLSYASVEAHSLPCKGIGGDFYDVISMDDGLYIVVADISGKGLSAALLGATLQGLIYAQILARQPLAQIALFANQYLCHKNIGKYATLVMLRHTPDGHVEYINCGHVQPLIHSGEQVYPLDNSNFPVGLFSTATFASGQFTIKGGERILIVTDGVTEAETPQGNAYGEERLRSLILAGATLDRVLQDVTIFIGGAPLEDDCTLLEIRCTACSA